MSNFKIQGGLGPTPMYLLFNMQTTDMLACVIDFAFQRQVLS